MYRPDWESIDSRPVPAWFGQSKFGIFIHWGVYSVPAWGPKRNTVNTSGEAYAEWYWAAMQNRNGQYWRFHEKTYGADAAYQDFAPQFRAELFDPGQWAELFRQSGAHYVILTSKHHDGFCLWPSAHSWNWNSVDIGPHRDLVGDLTAAVRTQGLRMGLYYSLYEWFRPLWKTDPARYVRDHMRPQLEDLICRYQPALLFTDGEWDQPSEVWRSCEFLAWLFNESPVREEIVVNDRWGRDTRSRHGGYFTTEYGEVGGGTELAGQRIWEENRAIGASFGYNRNEDLADYMTEGAAIHLLVNTVSRGGNLNLDVGPSADGRIPVIMQERLTQIGQWLQVNGDAIYGTTPWREPGEGDWVRYTRKGDVVYALCLRWPSPDLALSAPRPGTEPTAVRLLGYPEAVPCRWEAGRLRIEVPRLSVDEVPCRHAYVLELRGIR